jgi:hypothetical protein
MKFKNITRQVAGHYTRDGKTIPVTRTMTSRVPALPRDWQTIALATALSIIFALTFLSVAWSTWSIGSLLGGGLGFACAIVFDVGWIVSLLLEYLSRYDETKRGFPTKLGWLLLVLTMIAIAWHGMLLGSTSMAVVGAFVSFFAKMLWIAVMKHVNAQLSEEDKQWVAAEVSSAQASAAIASVRRQTARIEQRAALELLAMEKEKREVAEAFGLEIETSVQERVPVELEMPKLTDMKVSDAIRFVKNQKPELSPGELAETLVDYGVDATADYVKQVLSRTPKVELEPEAEIIELRK